MPGLLDLTYALNVLERSAGVLASFINADWKHAGENGPGGLIGELARTATGTNTWQFRVAREDGWTGGQIEDFLFHYGIKLWNRGVTSDHIHFTVEERQANWAEYLMLRRGIPVEQPLYNPLNAEYGRQHTPDGDQPPAWADRKKDRGFLSELLDLF